MRGVSSVLIFRAKQIFHTDLALVGTGVACRKVSADWLSTLAWPGAGARKSEWKPAEHRGDAPSWQAVLLEQTGGTALILGHRPSADDVELVELYAGNGMTLRGHGTFLSWLRAWVVSVTPATHLGLLFARYRGAVSPSPGISQMSGLNQLSEAGESLQALSLGSGVARPQSVAAAPHRDCTADAISLPAHIACPHGERLVRRDAAAPFFIPIRPGRADARRALSRFLSVVPARWFGVFPSSQRFGGERA